MFGIRRQVAAGRRVGVREAPVYLVEGPVGSLTPAQTARPLRQSWRVLRPRLVWRSSQLLTAASTRIATGQPATRTLQFAATCPRRAPTYEGAGLRYRRVRHLLTAGRVLV